MTTPTPPLAREAEPMSAMSETEYERLKRGRTPQGRAEIELFKFADALLATIATLKRERDEARAEGFRQGIEAAAKSLDTYKVAYDARKGNMVAMGCAAAIETAQSCIRALQPPKEP